MSKAATNTNNAAAIKPATSTNTAVKPKVARPTSNTNVNMEYRHGIPSFTKKGK